MSDAPLIHSALLHRHREHLQRLEHPGRAYWTPVTRDKNTWNDPGLNYWLTQCVHPKYREHLGAIADHLWGGQP